VIRCDGLAPETRISTNTTSRDTASLASAIRCIDYCHAPRPQNDPIGYTILDARRQKTRFQMESLPQVVGREPYDRRVIAIRCLTGPGSRRRTTVSKRHCLRCSRAEIRQDGIRNNTLRSMRSPPMHATKVMSRQIHVAILVVRARQTLRRFFRAPV